VTDRYILDEHGQPVPCEDLATWAQWFETADRRVAQDLDEGDEGDAGKKVRVSTVFLGLDHNWGGGPPILWETLVFGGALDGEMARYTSLADALAGHQAMCARVSAQGSQRPGKHE
jgi:hypothetical protein